MPADILHSLLYYGALFAVLFVSIAICLVQFARARKTGDPFIKPLSPNWKPPKSIDGSGRWR